MQTRDRCVYNYHYMKCARQLIERESQRARAKKRGRRRDDNTKKEWHFTNICLLALSLFLISFRSSAPFGFVRFWFCTYTRYYSLSNLISNDARVPDELGAAAVAHLDLKPAGGEHHRVLRPGLLPALGPRHEARVAVLEHAGDTSRRRRNGEAGSEAERGKGGYAIPQHARTYAPDHVGEGLVLREALHQRHHVRQRGLWRERDRLVVRPWSSPHNFVLYIRKKHTDACSVHPSNHPPPHTHNLPPPRRCSRPPPPGAWACASPPPRGPRRGRRGRWPPRRPLS